ncbi:MAG: putative DNA modification/repair radical SAM protein [Oscillospiraceae bacterium]|nr:putative DNA modification/repair radical SAM protein [Oscillospiraceae bacterium]
MDLMQKLECLTAGAKYDAACTSSGVDRAPTAGGIGSAMACGCCHSFAEDGRCVSLLKVLMTNSCIYDCAYCVNRRSNDVPRVTFTPEELASLTIEFYRRNYIEGLFLSSGVLRDPDYTMERMIRVLELLRHEHHFNGYLHVKAIPGASQELIWQAGCLADRISVNIEFPSERSLNQFAPDKSRRSILGPMDQIARMKEEQVSPLGLPGRPGAALTTISGTSQGMIKTSRSGPRGQTFAGAGQATQMIIGASPESDLQIMRLAQGLYRKYALKRVFYSAYIPVNDNGLLPAIGTKPPLLREHRLYQADFLLRQYHFDAEEILDERNPDFNPYLDPKCNWALHHPAFFPVDVHRAGLEELLRVPGIGPRSAKRIVSERRGGQGLDFAALKRMGVVLKRARFFLITKDYPRGMNLPGETVARALLDPSVFTFGMEQLSLYTPQGLPGPGDVKNIQEAREEAVKLLVA